DKTILCPIDFSDSSILALKYAIQLAQEEQSGVTVLYSFRLIQQEENQEIHLFKKSMEEEARKRFSQLEEFFTLHDKVPHNFFIEIGFMEDNIAGHLRKNSVSKVVVDRDMCQAGEAKNGIPKKFLESLNVPVIMVPEQARIS